jgi:putative PIN family toxin of toxin-antitoxin system
VLKVVFDTNIFISAFLFGGVPEQLINHAFEQEFKLFISPEILNEINAVLVKKFNYPPSRVQQVVRSVKRFSTIVIPSQTITKIKAWPPDNRILECCQEAKANYLVSGDKKHLLLLKKFKSTKIVTAQEFLKILKKQ